MDNQNEVEGLGGWLILVAIGIIVSPIRILATYVPLYSAIFTDGTWEALTTAGSVVYNPLWGPLLVGEILFNSSIFVASIYLIYLFFSKHYLFPRVYIALFVVSLIFIPLDAWLASFVLPDELVFDPETAKGFAQTVIGAIIWVPYMLVSKRVRNTFIEKRPGIQMQTTAIEEPFNNE